MRERKEVQEMLRRATVLACCAALGLPAASLWKNKPGRDRIRSVQSVDVSEKKNIFDEYGLQSAEEADIPPNKVTAYRFKDSTGAVAASFWLTGSSQNVALQGNYVFTCSGPCGGLGAILAAVQ